MNRDTAQLTSYFDDLNAPYMGIDALAVRDSMGDNGNMPHMVIDSAGAATIVKDVDEPGWTPHPAIHQPNFTVGLKLDESGRASEAQIDKLREIRSTMKSTDALASYNNGAGDNTPQQGYIRLGSEIANAGDMRAALGMQSKVSDITRAWEDMPASFRLGFIRAKQAIYLSAARAQDEIGAALDDVAALQEEYETLKAQTGAEADTGWAESLYNDVMHNMGTYSPVIAGSTAVGFAGSAATPLTGIALGGAAASTLNAALDHGLAILDAFKDMAVDLADPEAMRQKINDAGRTAEKILDKADTEAIYGGLRGLATSFVPAKLSLPFQKYASQGIEKVAQPAVSGFVSGASRVVEYTAKQLDGLATKIAGQFDTGTITHAATGLFDIRARAGESADNAPVQTPGKSAPEDSPDGLAARFRWPALGKKPQQQNDAQQPRADNPAPHMKTEPIAP